MKTKFLPLLLALAAPAANGALALSYDPSTLTLGDAVGQSWDPTGTEDEIGFTTSFASGTVVAATGTPFTQVLSGGNTANITSFNSFANNADFTYELWIRPSDLSGDHNLFETGGFTIGTALTISDAEIQFTVRENCVSNTVSSTLGLLPTDFIQVVGVVDMGATSNNTTLDDTLTLYINGLSVGSTTFASGITVGTDGGRFGGTGTNIARPDGFSNPHAAYDGELALARFYDTALDSTEVNTLFTTIPEPSSAILSSLGMLFLLRRRRA